jgi:hypothetical protein
MFKSNQFAVNEAWLVVKVNDFPLLVGEDAYDMYVIMDVASTYVFGHVLSNAADDAPPEEDVQALFMKAWAAKRQWPKRLMLTGNTPVERVFRLVAENNGIAIESVSLSSVSALVRPVKKSFASGFR